MNQKLTLKEIVSYALGNTGYVVIYMIFSGYLTMYYTDFAGIDAALCRWNTDAISSVSSATHGSRRRARRIYRAITGSWIRSVPFGGFGTTSTPLAEIRRTSRSSGRVLGQ